MAYENIKFSKSNMVFVDGYFYMFDESNDLLWQKLSNGSVVSSYPLGVLVDSPIKSVEFDGVYFWSLEDITDGVVIKKWQIENNIVELKDTFEFKPDFSSEAFTIEHYNTFLATSISGGETVLHTVDDYSSVITSGTLIHIGPNDNNEVEEISATSVSGAFITLSSGVNYNYAQGNKIDFNTNIWIFNNNATGSLYKQPLGDWEYTAVSGVEYTSSEYDNITACTFNKIYGATSHTKNLLIYVKNTNLKFLDVITMNVDAIATIDNIKTDNITELKIYDLSVGGTNIYRLQKEASYYGNNYNWSTYNYVVSTSRKFLNTVSLSAYPVILPANAVNVAKLTMIVNDQYGNGMVNKPVFFDDDDDVGFITINPAYTDYFFGTGSAESYYKAGVAVRTVLIQATATQYD